MPKFHLSIRKGRFASIAGELAHIVLEKHGDIHHAEYLAQETQRSVQLEMPGLGQAPFERLQRYSKAGNEARIQYMQSQKMHLRRRIALVSPTEHIWMISVTTFLHRLERCSELSISWYSSFFSSPRLKEEFCSSEKEWKKLEL